MWYIHKQLISSISHQGYKFRMILLLKWTVHGMLACVVVLIILETVSVSIISYFHIQYKNILLGCCALFCGPCFTYSLAVSTNESCWSCMCVPYASAMYRMKIRTAYKIRVSIWWLMIDSIFMKLFRVMPIPIIVLLLVVASVQPYRCVLNFEHKESDNLRILF